MKPEYWILSLSGGKDSTAMALEWLDRHQKDPFAYPLHEIIYCDVGMEFPAMMRHIDRLKTIFSEAGIRFTCLKSEHSFAYWMLEYQPKHHDPKWNQYRGRSWPSAHERWCSSELKREVLRKYLAPLRHQYSVIQLVGLAADETKRLQRKNNQNHRHPVAEWGWTEADCLQYCYERGFDWEGLYRIFHRVSCWCCPLKSLPELQQLRKHFPDLWARLLDMEHRTWRKFRADYSVDDLEARFRFEDTQLWLPGFEDQQKLNSTGGTTCKKSKLNGQI